MPYLSDLQHHPWEDAVRLGAARSTTGSSGGMSLLLHVWDVLDSDEFLLHARPTQTQAAQGFSYLILVFLSNPD